MNISTSQIIKDWVPNDSKVIDFGCGDGSLLKDLINEKNACGYGVEIDLKKIQECVVKGLSVIQKILTKVFKTLNLLILMLQ